MPTKYDRILVRKDPELADALERVAALLPARPAAAALVHDLAIRGARAFVEDEQRRGDALERMIARSTSEDPGYDVAVLLNADAEAWRQT